MKYFFYALMLGLIWLCGYNKGTNEALKLAKCTDSGLKYKEQQACWEKNNDP